MEKQLSPTAPESAPETSSETESPDSFNKDKFMASLSQIATLMEELAEDLQQEKQNTKKFRAF
jgi:hypothetical protein